jgi:hypothetical protein
VCLELLRDGWCHFQRFVHRAVSVTQQRISDRGAEGDLATAHGAGPFLEATQRCATGRHRLDASRLDLLDGGELPNKIEAYHCGLPRTAVICNLFRTAVSVAVPLVTNRLIRRQSIAARASDLQLVVARRDQVHGQKQTPMACRYRVPGIEFKPPKGCHLVSTERSLGTSVHGILTR